MRAKGDELDDSRPREEAAQRVARLVAHDAGGDEIVVALAEEAGAESAYVLAHEPQRHRKREHAPEEQKPFGDGSRKRGGDVDVLDVRTNEGLEFL